MSDVLRRWKPIVGLGALSTIIAAIVLGISFASRTAAGAQLPIASGADEVYRGAQACAECHPTEHQAWVGTMHAQATADPVFRADWADHGYDSDCLECHATGFDPQTEQIALEGITCEECHGPFNSGHPPSVMPVAEGAEACADCHRTTFNEWKLSLHGQQGVDCITCHAIHSQGHQLSDGRLPCASCHAERYEDFAHATHAAVGADCETCHMYTPPAASMTEGRYSTGHTFTIGPAACASCHRDAIHTRREIPELLQQISALRADLPTGAAESLQQLEGRVDELQDASIRNLYLGLAAGGVIGAAAGLAGAFALLWVLERTWKE